MNINFNISTLTKSKLQTDEFILLLLLEKGNKITQREMGEILNCHERTIIRNLKKLYENKYITKSINGRYSLTDKLIDLI